MRGIVLVVDVANVVGSVPDGWWRDRAGAAARLLGRLASLPGQDVALPDGVTASVVRVVAVLEGAAKAADDVPGVDVVRAPADGDTTIVDVARSLTAVGADALVVSADRALRDRLDAMSCTGPRWLLARLPHIST